MMARAVMVVMMIVLIAQNRMLKYQFTNVNIKEDLKVSINRLLMSIKLNKKS